MNRRSFLKGLVATAAGVLVPGEVLAEPERRVWALDRTMLGAQRLACSAEVDWSDFSWNGFVKIPKDVAFTRPGDPGLYVTELRNDGGIWVAELPTDVQDAALTYTYLRTTREEAIRQNYQWLRDGERVEVGFV